MIRKVLSMSVIAFLVTAAVGSAAQAAPSGDAAACAAALDVVTAQVEGHKSPRPWAVIGQSGSRDDGLTASALRKATKKDPPSPVLAAKFVHQEEVDPLAACADVRGFLERNKIAHDQATIDQITAKPGKNALEIFSLSLPVLSADGKDALADTSEPHGANGVRGLVVHLRKDAKGHWRKTDAFVNITG